MKDSIKRYRIEGGFGANEGITEEHEDESGEYARYADVERLQARIAELEELIARFRACGRSAQESNLPLQSFGAGSSMPAGVFGGGSGGSATGCGGKGGSGGSG